MEKNTGGDDEMLPKISFDYQLAKTKIYDVPTIRSNP
jgi:hypothetical protein